MYSLSCFLVGYSATFITTASLEEAEGNCSWKSSGCGSAKNCASLSSEEALTEGEWLTSPSGDVVATLVGGQIQILAASKVGKPLWAAPASKAAAPLTAARVLDGSLVLQSSGQTAWTSPRSSVKIRFTVTSTRASSQFNEKQISEFSLWRGKELLSLKGAQTTAPGGRGPGHQGPDNAVDGNPETKWYDQSRAPLEINVMQELDADSFAFTTADDMPSRDPVQWVLESSKDGSIWNPLHTQNTNYDTPDARKRSTEKFAFTAPFTSGAPTNTNGAYLALRDSGVLVVQMPDGSVTWSSGDPSWSPRETSPEEKVDEETRQRQQMGACAPFLTCDSCIASSLPSPGCGWCLATRRCVADVPWICQGQEDHVSRPGSSGPGQRSCPTRQAIEQAHAERRERAAAAALPPVDENDRTEQVKLDSTNSNITNETQKAENTQEDTSSKEDVDPELLKELTWRARMAEVEKGTRPYQVLKVTKDASASNIRKAYRKLSLQFHPDKWLRMSQSLRVKAEAAFADIQKAFETIGSPDKRAAFDEYQGNDFGQHWEQETNKKWRGDEDFYFGDAIIATLTKELWERRLAGKTIWLIEFYAAWCPACRNTRQQFKEIAIRLENTSVEVGAVNCVRQTDICGDYVGITSYPSLRLLNREFGMVQHLHSGVDMKLDEIVKSVEKTSAEWRWLFGTAQVHWDLGKASFEKGGYVADSPSMWVVSFIDGRECPSCKATCTNLMRLSASLRGLPVEVGAVDCSLPQHREFCYEDNAVPAPPHRPLTKLWRIGAKNVSDAIERGELLYSPADIEPHLAFMIVEKSIRLALANQLDPGALADYVDSEFTGEEKDDEKDNPGGGGGGWNQQAHGPSSMLNWAGDVVRKLPRRWQQWNGASTPQIGQ